jgi:hypothetical protein
MPPKTIVDKLFYNMTYVQCYSSFENYDMAEKYLIRADSLEQQLEKNGYSFRRALVTADMAIYIFQKAITLRLVFL